MDRFRLDPAPNLKVLLKLAAEEEDLGVYGLEIDDVVNVSPRQPSRIHLSNDLHEVIGIRG